MPDGPPPSSQEAAAWFIECARARVAAGERLDADAVRLLIAIAPDDDVVMAAIRDVDVETTTADGLAPHAHTASALLERAVQSRDESLARQAVSSLEELILQAYRPGCGTGRFEDDVAVAGTMLDAYDVGGDDTHLMLAEELMLTVVRRYWDDLAHLALAPGCEAALVFSRLAERAGKPEYRERSMDVMRAFAATYRDYGLKAAPYVSALQVIC